MRPVNLFAIASRFRMEGKFRGLRGGVRNGAGVLLGVVGAGFMALGTATAQVAELPAGPNRDVVSRECGACHDLSMVVDAAGASREAWNDTIDEMIRYGMRIDPEDRPKILDYLADVLKPSAQKPAVR